MPPERREGDSRVVWSGRAELPLPAELNFKVACVSGGVGETQRRDWRGEVGGRPFDPIEALPKTQGIWVLCVFGPWVGSLSLLGVPSGAAPGVGGERLLLTAGRNVTVLLCCCTSGPPNHARKEVGPEGGGAGSAT